MTFNYTCGKEPIPIDLIGMNASLCGGLYNDRYIEELEARYPFEGIAGESVEKLKDGVISEAYRFNSKLHICYTNHDIALKVMLIGSARAGKWQPVIIEDSKRKGMNPERLRELDMSASLSEQFGLANRFRMSDAGILIPLELYAKICSEAEVISPDSHPLSQYCYI